MRDTTPGARGRLKARLTDGDAACYGLWITLESPAVTEIAAALALDWVCIDMEHGSLGYREVAEHLRALRGSETSGLVRVPQLGQSEIKRVLDLGAHGVIVPWIEGRADAERAVQFGRYPPHGQRGIGGERAATWGLGTAQYLAHANDEVLIIPLIETAAAVAEIDHILLLERGSNATTLPGLNAIFFGPADLSASYGYTGQWEGPGVAETIQAIREQATRSGIATGILARSTAEAALRRDQGFRMIGLGSDTGMLIHSLRDARRELGLPDEPRFWF